MNAANRDSERKAAALSRQDEHFFEELTRTNNELANLQRELAQKNAELIAAQQELLASEHARMQLARLAGMAEIATNVLHNVGNVLNSVNMSATLLSDQIRKSKADSFTKVAALVKQHAGDLVRFFTTDERGARLPDYLEQFGEHLLTQQQGMLTETDSLRANIEHIKAIVAMQQEYAHVTGIAELTNAGDLIEEVARLNAPALARDAVELVKEIHVTGSVELERQKVLQVLMNLIGNAQEACKQSERADKRIRLRVEECDADQICFRVSDNGVGIAAENLERVFNLGYTTRAESRGFGLHFAANAATEMRGSISAHSDGPGTGATFALKIPRKRGSGAP